MRGGPNPARCCLRPSRRGALLFASLAGDGRQQGSPGLGPVTASQQHQCQAKSHPRAHQSAPGGLRRAVNHCISS